MAPANFPELATSGHDQDSDYVRDQLVARTVDCNGKRYRPDGEFVLYWMQSTQRLEENWALRAAIRTADRVNLPLVIHQGLDPTYPHAADRHHTFILQGARDTAALAASSRSCPTGGWPGSLGSRTRRRPARYSRRPL